MWGTRPGCGTIFGCGGWTTEWGEGTAGACRCALTGDAGCGGVCKLTWGIVSLCSITVASWADVSWDAVISKVVKPAEISNRFCLFEFMIGLLCWGFSIRFSRWYMALGWAIKVATWVKGCWHAGWNDNSVSTYLDGGTCCCSTSSSQACSKLLMSCFLTHHSMGLNQNKAVKVCANIIQNQSLRLMWANSCINTTRKASSSLMFSGIKTSGLNNPQVQGELNAGVILMAGDFGKFNWLAQSSAIRCQSGWLMFSASAVIWYSLMIWWIMRATKTKVTNMTNHAHTGIAGSIGWGAATLFCHMIGSARCGKTCSYDGSTAGKIGNWKNNRCWLSHGRNNNTISPTRHTQACVAALNWQRFNRTNNSKTNAILTASCNQGL